MTPRAYNVGDEVYVHNRFNCIDTRCGMDLDEIDPAHWAKLDAATDEYIAREDGRFDQLCKLLVHNLGHERPADVNSLRLGKSALRLHPLCIVKLMCHAYIFSSQSVLHIHTQKQAASRADACMHAHVSAHAH